MTASLFNRFLVKEGLWCISKEPQTLAAQTLADFSSRTLAALNLPKCEKTFRKFWRRTNPHTLMLRSEIRERKCLPCIFVCNNPNLFPLNE